MGLNLNYTPNRLVDITTLTEDQWLSWRRKGIGGSDVAVALNSSPYRTARDLYYDKIGVVMSDDGPDKSITFQIGHLLEDVVAQIFAKKTGLSVYEDHWMYQHPFFPFLIADVDRFVTLPDGRKAILECKTAHYDMQFKWANGAVPRHYELQVRHYMSVMNIDVAFIACLFSNNENDFVWQKIERDLEEEENTIMELSAFWNNHVMARVEPPLVEKPDAVLESLRRYFGPADKSEPTVDLDRKFVVNLKEILALKEEKRSLDAQVKAGEFLQSDDFMKQAKFIAEAANMTVAGWEKPVYLSKPTESVFEDVEVAPLLRSLLTEYLEERGIPYAIASRHCCRLNYGVRGKRYFAVGFPNMAGGYEVRSRYFKGCIPPKSVSLVKANDIPADECLVFEGFMDFLSAVTLGVTGNADCLVLNSVANVEKAAGLLDGYGRIGCFLDRDEAGRRTLAALTMRYGERVTDRSSLYDGCKDLNEYLQLTTKKQKNNHLKIEEQ